MDEHEPKTRFGTTQTAFEQVKERTAQGYHEMEEMIERHPAQSALLMFGLGVGLGIWLGSSLVHSEQKRRMETAGYAEKLGRQILEAISGAIPESVSSRMHR